MPRKQDRQRIAIVVPGIQYGGGVPTMASFLYQTLQSSERYEPFVVSLAVSASDAHSLRLLSPASWLRGVQTQVGQWRSIPVTYVGAVCAELEIQRYRPRQALDQLLADSGLIQIVAGTPAWGAPVLRSHQPRCLYVATTIGQDRRSLLQRTSGLRGFWHRVMTWCNAKLEPKVLTRMDHVFALSPYTYDSVRAHVDQRRLTLAMPGIDTSIFYPPDSYRPDGPILSVGRFSDPRKNVRLLLAAYRQLRAALPTAPRLMLVGDRPAPDDWSLAVEWGIDPFIDVCIDLTPVELAPLYRQASLFVLASDEEGLGIVILEAMASGLPVISTKSGGPDRLVSDGQTGFLVPVRDGNALSQKMMQLLGHPVLRQEMGNRGYEQVLSEHSLAATGRVFLDTYDRILEGDYART